MISVEQLLSELNRSTLTRDEEALRRCAIAKQFEDKGDYEQARQAMGQLWQRVGEAPSLGGLEETTKAEVLLRSGSLTGWIGNARQLAGAQEWAKDLLSQSMSLFRGLNRISKALEAQIEIAWCYSREGAFHEAQALLQDTIVKLKEDETDLKAVALVRGAFTEWECSNLHAALKLLGDAANLINNSTNSSLKGRYYTALGVVHRNLAAASNYTSGHLDRALMYYTAASYHFEEAGHVRYCALVRNNLGFLLLQCGRLTEAEQHLDEALKLYKHLRDEVRIAETNDTKARLLLAQGKSQEAEKLIGDVIKSLGKGEDNSTLAEALTTQGLILTRNGKSSEALNSLERAAAIAEQIGDRTNAGRALLTILEEEKNILPPEKLITTYDHTDQLLANAKDIAEVIRLRDCARFVVAAARDLEIQRKQFNQISLAQKVMDETSLFVVQIQQVALSAGPVLIKGASKSERNILARKIHEWSGRSGRFIEVACASSKRFRSTLATKLAGVAARAAAGSVYLDEVEKLDAKSQAILLRFVETGEVHSLFNHDQRPESVRIIAGSSQSLETLMEAGQISPELFYRLNTLEIDLAPTTVGEDMKIPADKSGRGS